MTRFYLLRHGETEWNHQGNRYCGITNISLNEIGENQARLAGAAMKGSGISAIYCSSLRRSRETGAIIGSILDITPSTDERLCEMNFGSWEGLTRQEITANDPAGWQDWLTHVDTYRAGQTGETGAEVAARYSSFFHDKNIEYSGKSILVVGHNTANRLFIAATLGLPFKKYRSFTQHNCGISVIDIVDENYIWVRLNETAHLRSAKTLESSGDLHQSVPHGSYS